MKNSENPAFPVDFVENHVTEKGLTKREYFAGVAMQGLLSQYNLSKPEDQEIVCKMSVQLADELLNQLEK